MLSEWAQVHQVEGGTCVQFEKALMLQWGLLLAGGGNAAVLGHPGHVCAG